MQKITHLKAVQSIAADANTDTVLAAVTKFITTSDILSEWDETDVSLERADRDETKVGKLNEYEKQLFIIGTLLQQVLKEAMIDLEADSTGTLAKIMREDRVNMSQAADKYRKNINEYLNEDEREHLNKIGLTIGYTMSAYEWSIRLRYATWHGPLIVRSGFVAYAYNG